MKKQRHYTLKCPLRSYVSNNLTKGDVDKVLEISVITNCDTDEDKVVVDIMQGLGSFFYSVEQEHDYLVQLEKELWSKVDCLENLKTCILEDK